MYIKSILNIQKTQRLKKNICKVSECDMLEIEMVKDCYAYMEQKQEYKRVACEIPFLSRCIDMVLVSKKDEMITIEFKLEKWRAAIEQALDHKQGADYAYICIPKRNPSSQLINAVQEAGIGLLFYDAEGEEKVQEYLPAPKSDTAIPFFRSELMEMTERLVV